MNFSSVRSHRLRPYPCSTERPNGHSINRNLHEQILDELGFRIVRGDYAESGTLPRETDLAAALGISRNALREAVKVLASKGLVEARPKTGTRARPCEDWDILDPRVLEWQMRAGLHLKQALELVEFRLVVEPKAAYLAALRASAEEITAIQRNCAALEECVGKPRLIPDTDIRFHSAIIRASGNRVLIHLGRLIAALMHVQVAMTTEQPGSFERGLPLHRRLAEAIAARQAPEAEATSHALVLMPYRDLCRRHGVKVRVWSVGRARGRSLVGTSRAMVG
ncbi:MAG: FadR/GntR family transcriptional regulator [Acetobacteraceae bacterium]